MNFRFGDDEVMLRDSLSSFLRTHYDFEGRTKSVRGESGWRREIWTALARDVGILGIGVPEELGGVGGGAIQHMIVMEEFGRVLLVEPYLETVVLGAGALVASGGARAAALLRSLVAGEAIVAFAWAEPGSRYDVADTVATASRDGDGWRLDGCKSVVTASPWADHLLVVARSGCEPGCLEGLSLFVMDKTTAGITEDAYTTIDGRRAAHIRLTGVRLPADAMLGGEGEAGGLVLELLDRGIAAVAAEAVGAMERMHADTVAYLGDRKQFGQPLAAFQVLQHRLADMYMQIELARSATYLVTLRLDAPPAERMLAASTAKVTVGHACRLVGQGAIQLHGGMGITDELAVTHHFRRTTTIETEFGDADYHVGRHIALTRATRRSHPQR